MAKKQPEAAKQARALVDIPSHNVKSGQAFQADADVIAMLVLAGEADDHIEAVAAAKG